MNLLASPFAPPIRFLLFVIFGYATVRAFSLMSMETARTPATVFVEREAIPPEPIAFEEAATEPREVEWPAVALQEPQLTTKRTKKARTPFARVEKNEATALVLMPVDQQAALMAIPVAQIPALNTPAAMIPPAAKRSNRFSGYGWVFWRGGGIGSSQLPSLGGRQAGLRLDWQWHDIFAVLGRLVTTIGDAPMGGHQREGVIGMAYLPFRDRRLEIAAERRISLGGGRDAWQLRAAGGKEWAVKGWRLEAYGQVGLTGLRRRDGFAEGQVSVRKPIIESGNIRLLLGSGAWGAAQPGAKRLDIGPQAVADFKLGVPMRLSADYRVRVAGNARPASGPALTLSTSF